MRSSVIILTFLMSICAYASPSLIEVHFERQKKEHQYSITKDTKKKNGYIFSFINEKRKIKNKSISSSQFQQIKNEATRLLWANQFRKPASFENCKEYMSLKIGTETTRICQQNNSLTGKSYGFLNSLNNLIK